MALDMKQLLETVQVYGAPLYGAEPVRSFGTIDNAGDCEVRDGSLIVLDENGKPAYIPIRRSSLDKDPATHLYSIGEFVALRDASGTFEGKEWSVMKGEVKTFAY